MFMSEISDGFTTYLHCKLCAGKTEDLPTQALPLDGFPVITGNVVLSCVVIYSSHP